MEQTPWDRWFGDSTRRAFESAKRKKVRSLDLDQYVYVTMESPESKEIVVVEGENWVSYVDDDNDEGITEFLMSTFEINEPRYGTGIKRNFDEAQEEIRLNGFEVGFQEQIFE